MQLASRYEYRQSSHFANPPIRPADYLIDLKQYPSPRANGPMFAFRSGNTSALSFWSYPNANRDFFSPDTADQYLSGGRMTMDAALQHSAPRGWDLPKLAAISSPLRSQHGRRYTIAIAAALYVLAGITVSQIPDRFQSSAEIYIRNGEGLPTLRETMLATDNLETLIRLSGLSAQETPRDGNRMLLEDLRHNIVISEKSPHRFRIDYTDSDPQQAQTVVSNLLALYDETLVNISRTPERRVQLLRLQIDRAEHQLGEALQQKADFQSRNADVLPNPVTGKSRLEEARDEVRSLTDDLYDARAQRDNLEHQLEDRSNGIGPATTIANADGNSGVEVSPRIKLQLLRADLAAARATMTEQHPVVIALEHQIALSTERAGKVVANISSSQQPRTYADPIYFDIKQRLEDVTSRIIVLGRALAGAEQSRLTLENASLRVPEVTAEFLGLCREYDRAKATYEGLLVQRSSAEAATRNEPVASMTTIAPPETPANPTGPGRALLFSLAVVASTALCVGFHTGLGGFTLLGAGKIGAPLTKRH